jgi:hypothetical protein
MKTDTIRVPKEWDEACETCRGKGIVHKLERFELWTPAEYLDVVGHAYKLDAKYNAPSNAMVCVAHAGANITSVCKEGVALARDFGVPVVFEFNDAIAICHADSDPDDVVEQWHKRFQTQSTGE